MSAFADRVRVWTQLEAYQDLKPGFLLKIAELARGLTKGGKAVRPAVSRKCASAQCTDGKSQLLAGNLVEAEESHRFAFRTRRDAGRGKMGAVD